ncbi:MAG: hypothetical protein AAF197_09660 [Pseudomonadota bacterium]
MRDKTLHTLTILSSVSLIFFIRVLLIERLSYPIPYYDDWGMGGMIRFFDLGQFDFGALYAPWNGHLVFWSKPLNFAIFYLNQRQWDPQVMMVVNAFIWCLTSGLLVSIILRSKPQINHFVAIVFVILLWAFPTSILNTLWGVQTHSYLMILLSMAGIWMMSGVAYSTAWYFGIFLIFSAALTMGGGALAAFATLAVTTVRYVVMEGDRIQLKPTLLAAAILSAFSIVVLIHSSGGLDIYKARNLAEFSMALSRTLSFPMEYTRYAGLALLAPPLIFGLLAAYQRKLDDRLLVFTLTLFVYTVGIAIAISYARGKYGAGPNMRYSEFLQLYVVASMFALLILMSNSFALNKMLKRVLLTAWTLVFVFGAINQTELLRDDLAKRAIEKPYQQSLVKEYLVKQDIDVFLDWPVNYLPFASAHGLVVFLDVMKPMNMLHYSLQVPDQLENKLAANTGFVVNTVLNSEGLPDQENFLYQHENTIGSFDAKKGGSSVLGSFRSQKLTTERNGLMIPVKGSVQSSGLRLDLVDEESGISQSILPDQNFKANEQGWYEVIIAAPKNPFRIVATDNSSDSWLAFAAPRSIGRVSMWIRGLFELTGSLLYIALFCLLSCLYYQRSRAK